MPSLPDIIYLSTRASPLAVAQAEMVRDALLHAHPTIEPDRIQLLTMTTTGDQIQDRTLMEAGGKGLFTKEIEDALIDGRASLAIHSMKDVPTELPPGLVIDCLLPRADARDAFISPEATSINDLPQGAVLGTASIRRQALVKRLRPDLEVIPFRGNVQTRLRKLRQGEAAATFLAVAGLDRLGNTGVITNVMDPEQMLPAVAQGAIGIQRRTDDTAMAELLAPLNCSTTTACVSAERAMLAVLDGSCRTPIAGYALPDVTNGSLWLRGSITRPDGGYHREADIRGPMENARELGYELGQILRPDLPLVQP